MDEIKFGELNGYNSVIEYSLKILDIIKDLNSKNMPLQQMQELSGPEHEYVLAKLICMIQSLNFFQLYEKYGRNINISATNFKKILDFFTDFTIDGAQNLDSMQKEKIFRNCLAHGRYTLSMDHEGFINVIFDDPSAIIAGQPVKISGSMPYKKFRNLSSIYIKAVNLEETKIIPNPLFEHHSMKNFSINRIYQTFFSSIQKNNIIYNRNFESQNNYDEALRVYLDDMDSEEKYTNFQHQLKHSLKMIRLEKKEKVSQIDEEDIRFFKKYFDFIGQKKFVKFLNLHFDHLRQLKNFFKDPSKAKNNILTFVTMNQGISDYYKILTAILNSKNGNLFISEDGLTDLIDFIETINHMHEFDSTERASTKDFDEIWNRTLGRAARIDVTSFPLPERGQVLKYSIDNFSYITPILYSNMLVAMTSYAIGYAKEVNNNYEKGFLNFKDIDLREFQLIFDDINRPSIKTVDLHSKAVNALNKKIIEKRNPLIRKIKENLDFTNKKGKNTFDSFKDLMIRNGIDSNDEFLKKIENIKQKVDSIYQRFISETNEDNNEEYILQDDGETLKLELQNYIDIIQNNNTSKVNKSLSNTAQQIINKLSDAIKKINELKTMQEELNKLRQNVINTDGQAVYQDSSVFFNHIRNSFTHSYFKIDYDDLFSTGDFSKIKFHLEDFDESKRKTFEIELTSKDLLYLINAIQNRLNNSIANTQGFSLENIHLNMLRDDNGILRYDYTKYDSMSYPLAPSATTNTRPTNENFEAQVSEETLMKGLSSNILKEIQTAKDGEVEHE